ncbi:MAG TPA: bacillithiol biosynthesis cysteine-adding enzyme BshC [Polyangia bacterium]|jgi:bacillithiol biosynthesis cysteine-adding enzyme BshC|nr:bacillithiol biosynthesis cysteine-adding enzyme BshC [Polyangia bacterium]
MLSVPRPFSSSYLAGEEIARRFIALDFRSGADRTARTRAAAEHRVSPDLIAVLRAQQAALPAGRARAHNLEALAAGQTAVVATGQQVGLFLGPLYGFYKAASAIAVARELEAESGVRCVPLFWLQTEDHDFAEIASATVAGSGGAPITLSLPRGSAAEARVSVAHRHLPAEVGELLDRLAELLGPGPAAKETVALLRAHYTAGRPIAQAFAGVLAELFADEGLLIFDPREAGVAKLAAPIYREALDATATIGRRLDEQCAALAEAGFEQQIPLRPDCALVFGHLGAAAGPRYRLERPSGAVGSAGGSSTWRLAGSDGAFSDREIADALARDPLRFSTSALLRPIVQDTLLPTAAYVGGLAEVSYFAQTGPLYDHFRLAMPLIVPRARFRCLDPHTRRRLGELGLGADDVARPQAELVARLPSSALRGVPSASDLTARVATEIAPAVAQIAAAAAALDPEDRNLTRAAERTRAHVFRALARLTGRYARKLAERDGVTLGRLARVQNALAPGGVPQERAYAWPSLAGRLGPGALKGLVFARLAAVGPFTTALQDLEP